MLLDTTHLHTHMGCLDNNGHTYGIESLLDAITNLHGKALLHLQTACKTLDNTGNFGEAGDGAIWDIGNMGLAHKWEHVVLAHREEFDIFYHNHLLVLLLEHCRLQNCHRILLVTLGEV